MKVSFRKATEHDIDLIFNLDKAIFREEYHRVVKNRKEIEDFHKANDIFLIFSEDTPIGYY